MPDLTAEACREMYERIRPLAAFLEEWWMPMDLRLELVIRHHQVPAQVDGGMVLDYNVEL